MRLSDHKNDIVKQINPPSQQKRMAKYRFSQSYKIFDHIQHLFVLPFTGCRLTVDGAV